MNTINVESTEMTGNPIAGLIQSNKENEQNKSESIPSNTETETKTIELFGKNYNVVDDIDGLKTIAELKDHLPVMKRNLFSKLKADIKKNGMHDPILYIELPDGEKLVIDGHTRLKAATQLKLKSIETKEIKQKFETLDDVILWMIQQQFQRRNLSRVEKLNLAFLSKEMIVKRAKQNLSKAGKGEDVTEAIDTNKEIEKLTGVSRTTVVRYNRVVNSDSKKVKKQMLKGDISIAAAEKKIKEKKSPKTEKEVNEKKQSPTNIFSTYEEGIEALNKGDIEAFVLVRDKQKTKIFISKQMGKVGFFVVEKQHEEPIINSEATVEDIEKLAV